MTLRSFAGMDAQRQLSDVVLPAGVNRSGGSPLLEEWAYRRLLERTNALVWVEDNQDRIDSFVNGLTAPAAGVLRTVATGIAGAATVFVLA